MQRPCYQFGLSSLMWLGLFAALNCWMCTLGRWGVILAIVIDKHVLVAYLCWRVRIDTRRCLSGEGEDESPAAADQKLSIIPPWPALPGLTGPLRRFGP